jgi:putative FmdB family regulatory protein
MPTYEYRCDRCGLTTERFHAISAKPRLTCPDCGVELRRVLSACAGVIVKGRGETSAASGHCGTRSPCCGRETSCDTKPCDQ